MRELVKIISSSIVNYRRNYLTVFGAALSFYTILSLAPLLMLMVSVAGWVFGREMAQNALLNQITFLLGPEAAFIVDEFFGIVPKATGALAAVISFGTFIVGSSLVFRQLSRMLNRIWEVDPSKSAHKLLVTSRNFFRALFMAITVGFLLIVTMIMGALLISVREFIVSQWQPLASFYILIEMVVLIILPFFIFAIMYKVLPDAKVAWRDIWLGAAISTGLISFLTAMIGVYIAVAAIASVYGAVGTLIALMLWIYFSAMVFLFGAQVTRDYSKHLSSRISGETT